MIIRDIVNDQWTRKAALKLFSEQYKPSVKTVMLDNDSIKSIVRMVKLDTYESITIIPITDTGFIFRPRTGQMKTLPIYTLDGNIIACRGVSGYFWYPSNNVQNYPNGSTQGGLPSGGSSGGTSGNSGTSGTNGDGTDPSGGTAYINDSTTANDGSGNLLTYNGQPVRFR